MEYLYRFDSLVSLRKQRVSDPVFRARRYLPGGGNVIHDQAEDANVGIPEGQGVYCMSFWKNLEIALKQYGMGHVGWIIQRVRADHPVFARFERGIDQYLVEKAWYFWARLEIDSAKPTWSSVGIPHSDIEILKMDRTWCPMEELVTLSRLALPEWQRYEVAGLSLHRPIVDVRVIVGPEDNAYEIMIRQQSGPWTVLINNLDLLTGLTTHMVDTGQVRTKANWYCTYESMGHMASDNRVYGVQLAVYENKDGQIAVAPEGRKMGQLEVMALYERFGVAELLLIGNAWNY